MVVAIPGDPIDAVAEEGSELVKIVDAIALARLKTEEAPGKGEMIGVTTDVMTGTGGTTDETTVETTVEKTGATTGATIGAMNGATTGGMIAGKIAHVEMMGVREAGMTDRGLLTGVETEIRRRGTTMGETSETMIGVAGAGAQIHRRVGVREADMKAVNMATGRGLIVEAATDRQKKPNGSTTWWRLLQRGVRRPR